MTEGTPSRAFSGRGSDIYDRMLKPLFSDAYQYDRVASYYSSKSLLLLLEEFANVWKHGGVIRLIIGFHETMEISPALRTDVEVSKAIIEFVARAMMGETDELAQVLGARKDSVLPVIREIINQHGLYVKLVTPKVNFEYYKKHGIWPEPELGIFHSKFMIIHHEIGSPTVTPLVTRLRTALRKLNRQYYRSSSMRRDAGEKYSVVTGSMNETLRGYTENIEDAVLHRSWVDYEADVCTYFMDRFEQIWLGHDNDVVTMPFTDEFGAVLERLEQHEKSGFFSWKNFTETISNSPLYQGIGFSRIGLLPHQIAVYTEALSRWPIRVLLADEVGLGKTIEAGSIIQYLTKYCGIQRVLVLTPASLRKQWQQELQELFGLDFWVYDSTRQICEKGEEEVDVGPRPMSHGNGIDRLIVSWHWARIGAAQDECRFSQEDMPELLIVDEAHHARISEDASGEHRTQLYSLLKRMQQYIPHVILATATPYQTDILDYYSLLDILGVPNDFKHSLHQYSKWVRGESPNIPNTWVRQLKQIHQFIQEYRLKTEFPLIQHFEEIACQNDTTFYEDIVGAIEELPRDVVIATHPATLLATRNYRSNLQKLGYHFPTPHLDTPNIVVTEQQAQLLRDIEEYVEQFLGSPERSFNRAGNIGLMKSLYRQRIVSSMKAALDTLSNRRDKLNQLIASGNPEHLRPDVSDEFDASTNDDDDSMPNLEYGPEVAKPPQSCIESAKNEVYCINKLLSEVKRVFQKDSRILDPKIARLRELLKEHIAEGRKVLVFSRFTSTTGAIVEELSDFADSVGVGRFDGVFVGTYRKGNTESCTRKEIVKLLKSGAIRILVCSDAASEGLNLHSANVVINVDVPWNPSRLLQRFGRVDRLGQKAADVYLTNLYYPDSIEERMYRVLEDRRTDFRAVLGEVPEIMSERQKSIIQDLGNGASPMVNLTLDEIERERAEHRRSQIMGVKTIDVAGLSDKSPYKRLIETLRDGAMRLGKKVNVVSPTCIVIDRSIVVTDPLDDDFRSLADPTLQEFETKLKKPANRMMVRILESESGLPLAFMLEDSESFIPLMSNDWQLLFDFCFIGEPISLDKLRRFPKDALGDIMKHLRQAESWIWPQHDRMRTISGTTPAIPELGVARIGKELGYISVK